MKLEFNKDEIGLLTAMVFALGEDVKNGIFDEGDDEIVQRAKEAYSSLEAKVFKASFEIMLEEMSEDAMDAEILDEEE